MDANTFPTLSISVNLAGRLWASLTSVRSFPDFAQQEVTVGTSYLSQDMAHSHLPHLFLEKLKQQINESAANELVKRCRRHDQTPSNLKEVQMTSYPSSNQENAGYLWTSYAQLSYHHPGVLSRRILNTQDALRRWLVEDDDARYSVDLCEDACKSPDLHENMFCMWLDP